MALLSLKVTTAVTPAGGSAAATTTVKSAAVSVAAPITLGIQQNFVLGPPGVGPQWKGLYSSGTTYAQGDGVTGSNGHNYISLVSSNLNHDPTTDAGVHWADTIPPSIVSSNATSSPLLFVDSFMPSWGPSVDVTTQFNAALTAAGVIGATMNARCPLYLTPGRQYTVTNLTVPSYVEIIGTGAIINRDVVHGTPTSPTFSCSNSIDVCFRGLHFAPGAGTETAHHIFCSLSQRVRVIDCYMSSWGNSGIYFVDSQYLWCLHNEFVSVGMGATSTNAINLVNGGSGSTLPLKHFWVGHNFASGNTIQCEVVSSGTPTRTDPDCDGHIYHNTFVNLSTGHGWCMGIEQGTTGAAISGIEFTGNNCYQLNSANTQGSRTYAVLISTGVASPTNVSGITLTGGRVISNASGTNRGILIESTDTTITGVIVESGEIDIVWQNPAGGGNLTKLSIVGCQSHSGSSTQLQLGTNVDVTTLSMYGNTPITSSSPGVPATGVAVAQQPFNRHFYVTAGASTCTMAIQGGPSPVIPSAGFGVVFVPAGCTVTPTYAAAPTWTVQATP